MALDFLIAELAAITAQGLRRSLRAVDGGETPSGIVTVAGQSLIDFSSNDYLGLARHPDAAAAASKAASDWGTGARASRLVVGNLAVHESLERDLASFHGTAAALLFNSGYQANLGVLTALAGRDDLIVSDELNHASIIDGCRLSRAQVAIYRHGDASHAAELLAAPARRRFLVTESVFSMDGDRAPLASLREATTRAGAALVVDEAHAVGALGPGGRGLSAEAEVVPDVLVGTVGKALGGFGAYVAGSHALRDWLLGQARSFVFTTGLPATVVAASAATLAVVRSREGEERRAMLGARVAQLRAGLARLGRLGPGAGTSPIFPFLIGAESDTMAASAALLARGLLVQGIRPPTVPRGTSRLRIAASAAHSADQIDRLLAALSDLPAP